MGKTSVKAKVLYGEGDAQSLKLHSAVMEKAGYSVKTAIGRHAIEEAVRQDKFDVVVLGHTLSRDDRHHLPYMAKKANSLSRVLVIHASGKHHEVDAAIDSRDGEHVLLDALAGLLEPAYA
jgi:DNA-binding NtrC family response regulator